MPKLILFSDLHVNNQSENTCFEVLGSVLEHAKRLDATICFLGDWWDHIYRNGSLATDMHNRFIRFFHKRWDVPTLMIPGNHDYSDATEKEHALVAFSYASPHVTIFDVPTVHNNILWIPWRRKHEDLIEALNVGADIKCVFGHFDIVGALVNNTTKSEEGLRPAEFPPGIPIYSGHYHKPQQHENVTFVGSPYQTTQAECYQQKRFIVIDTNDFNNFESIPIQFGPNRFQADNVDDIPSTIALKDVVTLKLASGEAIPPEVVALRRRGVIVKIKRIAVTRPVRFELTPDTKPEQLLDAYAKGRDDPDVVAFIKGELKKLQTLQHRDLAGAIEWHEMSGVIGPFTKTFRINLNGSGLVLVTGQRDSEQGRSNGSGKSFCTCSAFLWCITGMSDDRSSGDTDKVNKRPVVATVVNPAVGRAQVVLKGKIGGRTFEIDRKYVFSKKIANKGMQKLVVKVDGQNITKATLDLTQQMLCDLFGVPSGGASKRPSHALHAWLIRTTVWSQTVPSSWIQLSDKHMKDELSWLSSVEIWDKVLDTVKEEIQKGKDSFIRIDGSIRHAKLDINTFKAQLERMKRSSEVFKENKAKKIAALEAKLAAIPATEFVEKTFEDPEPPNQRRPELHTQRYKLATEDMWKCKADLETAKNVHTSVPHPIVVPKVEFVDLEKAKKKVNTLMAQAVVPKTECVTCGRPFMDPEQKKKAEDRYNGIKKRLRQAERELLKLADKEKEMRVLEKKAEMAKAALAAGAEIQKLEPYIIQLQREIELMQSEHQKQQEAYELLVHDYTDKKLAVQKLRHEQALLREKHQKNMDARKRLEKELAAAHKEQSPFFLEIQQNETRIKKAEIQLNDLVERTSGLRKRAEMLRRCRDWVGIRGIRTYVLDNTLRCLEKSMIKFASLLFPDDDIHISLDHTEDGKVQRIIRVGSGCRKDSLLLSGGQYRRMEIASWMAMRESCINRSGIVVNTLFFDEATHNLDLRGVECLTEALRAFCKEAHNRSIMFITHENSWDTSAYDSTMKIVRKGEVSHIRTNNVLKRKCMH